MTRFYLFEKLGDKALHGIGTVLVQDSDTTQEMTVISCSDLSPSTGNRFFLKASEDSDPFEIECIREEDVDGVRPPASIAPFVYQVRRQ